MAESKIYCAFLRGVNVKGTTMKMADVCRVFTDTGLENVQSILASGNILFESELQPKILKKKIESALSEKYVYDAIIFLKSLAEIKIIQNKNPFSPDPNFHIYAFVSDENMSETFQDYFNNCEHAIGEDFVAVGENCYWRSPKGETLQNEFGKILGDKKLRNKFTSRNINTFEKILNKIK